MTRKVGKILALTFVGSLSLGGCLGGTQPGPSNPAPVDPSAGAPSGTAGTGTGGDASGLGLAPGSAAGGTGNTFDHPDSQVDPFAVLQRIKDEGPPEVSTKLHSCQKMKYATVGNVLTQLGVNMGATGSTSAAQLYKNGAQAMGAPNYGARVPEAIEITTAGATKLFDIFTQAAPEIIAAMANLKACQKAGTATQMFDAQGHITLDAIACITGAPAVQAQADLANQAITEASTQTIGQTIAVATILSAQHTCE
jgi:hypothetical protein